MSVKIVAKVKDVNVKCKPIRLNEQEIWNRQKRYFSDENDMFDFGGVN